MFNGFNLDDYQRKSYSKDPNKIFWLIDSSYARNQAHTLHFLAEDGQEKRISIRETYPFFYVRNMTVQAVESRLEFYEKKHLVHAVTPVRLNNPITRLEELVVKVETVAPKYVSNKKREDLAVSTIFKVEDTHNNHVAYHNIILNDTGYIMGMPYRFKGRTPILVEDELEENRERYKEVFELIPPEAQTVGESVFKQIHAVFPDFSRMMAACDIEVQANFAESVDANRAEVPITSIGITTLEDTVTFTLDNESLENDPPDDPSVFEDDTFKARIYNSEKRLLIDALKYIKELPQRLLVWFNGDDFDIPYIARRLELHGLKEHYGVEGYPISGGFFEKQHFIHWEGKIVLDLYKYFRNENIRVGAYHDKYPNNKLDTIAKTLLNKSKYDYEGQIEDLSSEELAFYNAKDCQLTFELATHDDNFPAFLLFFIMRFSNLSLSNSNRRGITAWWSGFQFRNMHEQQFFYPNLSMIIEDIKAMGLEEGLELKGGDVLNAVMGVHHDISIIDFASLYPTTIIKNNICYSTINCDHPECQLEQKTANAIEIPEGTMWTCTIYLGFMTSTLMFLREARVKIYKPRAKKKHPEHSPFFVAIAQFFKIFMNAAYGCFKNKGFAFNHILAAQAVTATSREKLYELAFEIRKLGGKVVYGDSVAGPEPVIAKINDSIPLIMSLENLWQTMSYDFQHHSYEQTKERMPVRGLKIWDGKYWNDVRALIRHATYKTMYRVSTGLGSVDVTSDHSLVGDDGEKLRPSDINRGKSPSSSVFLVDIVSPLEQTESLTQLLFFLFSLSGTASYSRSIYESQRTLAIHLHPRYADKAVKVLEMCNPIVEAFGSSYKIYQTGKKRPRIIIKFKSHVGLWKAVRDNCYNGEEKIRPVRTILGMAEEHQRIAYEYMKLYYYNPPKDMSKRWRFGTNVELQAYSCLAEKYDKQPFTFYPLPRGSTYHARYSTDLKRMTKVTELKTAAEYVFDLETEDGTFMVSNIKCHNTDSIFAANVKEGFEKQLSEILGMEVENEGRWKKIIQYKKKNYIKLNPNEKVVKGMVGIKKSTVPMIRDIFKTCINLLEVEMSNEEMLDFIYQTIKTAEEKIISRKFSLEEVQLSQTLNKDLCNPWCKRPKCERLDHYRANTPLVQATKVMIKYLKESTSQIRNIGRKGVVVDYVRTNNAWTPTVLATTEKVDTTHIVDQLYSVFRQLTAPLGFDDVLKLKESKEQGDLEEWFQ